MLMLNWTTTIRIQSYDMGYINRIDTRQEEKVNKMSNEELNAIIAGQTITMMIMFIVFLYILTN